MITPVGTNMLTVVRTLPDAPDVPLGTITLADDRLVFSDPDLEPLVNRWRISGIADADTFAELADGGWSNGYVTIKP